MRVRVNRLATGGVDSAERKPEQSAKFGEMEEDLSGDANSWRKWRMETPLSSQPCNHLTHLPGSSSHANESRDGYADVSRRPTTRNVRTASASGKHFRKGTGIAGRRANTSHMKSRPPRPLKAPASLKMKPKKAIFAAPRPAFGRQFVHEEPERGSSTSTASAPPPPVPPLVQMRPLRLEGFEWLLENYDEVTKRQQLNQRDVQNFPGQNDTKRDLSSRRGAREATARSYAFPHGSMDTDEGSARNISSALSKGVETGYFDAEEVNSISEYPAKSGTFSSRGSYERKSNSTQKIRKVQSASIRRMRTHHARPPSRQRPPPQALHLDLFNLNIEPPDTPKLLRSRPETTKQRRRPRLAFSKD